MGTRGSFEGGFKTKQHLKQQVLVLLQQNLVLSHHLIIERCENDLQKDLRHLLFEFFE